MTETGKTDPLQGDILYIDPFSGVSGDMLLGAFISLGVPLPVVEGAIERVIPGEIVLEATEVRRSSLAGVRCLVRIKGGPRRRSLSEMLGLVRGADIPESVRDGSMRVLGRLGEAEARAHGAGSSVHLHELGGQDTLADVVGTLAALHALGVKAVRSGSINVGGGTVSTEHGTMPVPAPATAFILEGAPVKSVGPEVELTTPTGAALVVETATQFGPFPPMTVTAVGTGAGERDTEGFPNLLRLFLGQAAGARTLGESVMIECGLDDASPEYLAPVTEILQDSGALEVHMIPVHTKKGRVGILVRVLAEPGNEGSVVQALLDHSGSAGLRRWRVERDILPRETVTVETEYGSVRVKRWLTPSGVWRVKPEFEDVQEISRRTGKPSGELRDRILAVYYGQEGGGGGE